ncbi:hypothetical protein LHYA1_G006937 [Lachnellula hyalina]|uniref:NACHT domain-containing protein n=1 Tax=Lachnellula hyalina TaxID=1316788 RepID=A0A8H8QZ68_9HELO|nr:uncharacterized protein LHYA1_G006937 [Lachnellula hyalina]TVY24004.1 hypothetical protein LHYA1_G006937 [Lachnellula hyalina]
MVLEALTALSLAATIVQFVDFSSKLLAKGHEIYVSVDGASIENNDLEAATKNLRDLSGRLNVSAVSRRGDTVEATSEPEVELIQLTTKCSAVARELLTLLDHLKVQPGSNRKWKTFQQALKSSLKQSQVDEIKSRLQAIRQELSLSVLVSLRESIDLQAIRSNAGFLSLESSTRALADQLIREQQKALSDHTNFLRHDQDKATRIVEAQHHQTRKEIIAIIHNEWAGVPSRRIGGISGDDGDDENPTKRQLVSNLILESLRFQTMDDRCEEIESAHKRTFGWIFEGTSQERMWANFPKWLSTGTGIYWMNGKAASGKSTLMKYVSSDTRTKDLLRHWAGEQRLIQAAHYFWNSGTAEQRSHAGLLRALLFKALRQCESLLPDIFPEIWIDKMSKPLFIIEDMERISWTLPRLSEAFDRLVCTQSNGLKFCLFVDGLDEYEGDYFDVIKTFTKISQSSSVKVCLSSRPLFDFVAAFQSCQSLRLQDLTFSDIESYINDELGTNTHMQILREQKPQEAEMLVFEIVNKADGVFLWVKLVVLSMLRGLRQSDGIHDLQLRLRLLPPSLEDLFSHILRRLEPVYLEQSSRIFQIFAEAQNSDRSLTSLELSFAEELDFRAVIREPTRQLWMEELLEREAQIETWLRTRCGGLIETCSGVNAYGSFTDARLSYLHRTVRDFLELPEIWRIVLRPTSGKRFAPRVALVQAQMLYIKRVLPFPTDLIDRISDLQHVGKRAIAFAQNEETATIEPQVMMLDELDRVCNNHVEDFSELPCNWTTSSNRMSSGKDAHVHQNSFLTLAIKTGLYVYVEEKLKLKPWLVKRAGRPLLQYAVSSENDLCMRDLRVNTGMVELLLRCGARVDEVYQRTTAWDLVLESLWLLLCNREPESTVAMWLSVVKLFLEHGADPSHALGMTHQSWHILWSMPSVTLLMK